MINIFEVFLPQLLAYPNVGDPLNAEAAHLMQGEPTLYEAKVRGKPYAALSRFQSLLFLPSL
jgi:ubiquitin-protein ligase